MFLLDTNLVVASSKLITEIAPVKRSLGTLSTVHVELVLHVLLPSVAIYCILYFLNLELETSIQGLLENYPTLFFFLQKSGGFQRSVLA